MVTQAIGIFHGYSNISYEKWELFRYFLFRYFMHHRATPSAAGCRDHGKKISILQNRLWWRTAVPLAALSVATIVEFTKLVQHNRGNAPRTRTRSVWPGLEVPKWRLTSSMCTTHPSSLCLTMLPMNDSCFCQGSVIRLLMAEVHPNGFLTSAWRARISQGLSVVLLDLSSLDQMHFIFIWQGLLHFWGVSSTESESGVQFSRPFLTPQCASGNFSEFQCALENLLVHFPSLSQDLPSRQFLFPLYCCGGFGNTFVKTRKSTNAIFCVQPGAFANPCGNINQTTEMSPGPESAGWRTQHGGLGVQRPFVSADLLLGGNKHNLK